MVSLIRTSSQSYAGKLARTLHNVVIWDLVPEVSEVVSIPCRYEVGSIAGSKLHCSSDCRLAVHWDLRPEVSQEVTAEIRLGDPSDIDYWCG
jgi:hypothetical protein